MDREALLRLKRVLDQALEGTLPDVPASLTGALASALDSLPPDAGGSEGAAPGPEAGSDQLLILAADSLATVVLASAPPRDLPAPLQGHRQLLELHQSLMSLRQFVAALARGDLSQDLRARGYLAGVLKALQADLRHLTWQTQRIAEGDLSQRVDFMGEFSAAFNAMVARLQETRSQLEVLATTDPLTGLYNRRQFFALAAAELDRARRYRRPFSLIMFDIDHFKRVNDAFGHAAGDRVLQAVAQACLAALRHVDVLGRYGGEEFVVLLPETGLAQAELAAERLRYVVGSTVVQAGQVPLAVTISLGISAFAPEDPEQAGTVDVDGLLSRADEALYEAKRSGRNRTVVWREPGSSG